MKSKTSGASKRTYWGVGPIALASLAVAACSSTSSSPMTTAKPPASTTTTISIAAAGRAYLTAVVPANAALDTFSTSAGQWTGATTNAEAEADAQPSITALQELNTTLTNGQWPSSSVPDVHTLIGDIAALAGDLQGLSTLNLLDSSAWTATFQRDASSLASAVALVRHDLGLPPATPAG